jgi:hypothetical protein
VKRALTRIPVLLAAVIVAACAVDGVRDQPKGAMTSHTLDLQDHGRILPAGHPPVPGWASMLPEGHPPVARLPMLPEGHPPVMRMPALPEGHPPVPGWHPPLPEGHPACPALGNGSEQGAAEPSPPRPARFELIRT